MSTKRIFKDLAIYMIGFGVMMGIVFPFFVVFAAKVPSDLIFTPIFFVLCIMAGFFVGLFNIFLAKKIVGDKIRQLSDHMRYVENRLIHKAHTQSSDDCADEHCYIPVTSDDEIGECAKAFNALVKSLSNAFKSETAIRNFTELLSSRLELDQLAKEALASLMENFHAAGGAIIIEKEGDLSILTSFGIRTTEKIIENNMLWQVIEEKKRSVIDLPEDILISGLLLDFRPRTVLLEPILYKEVVLGVIVLAGVTEFTNEMKNNMEQFGQGLALAFKNAIVHDQLQKLAANDPLTGIFNRRFGLSRLKDEFSRAIRTNQPVGVLIFDIDHFKKINDTYGHLAGDKVLLRITQTAKYALREGDVFLRYGGEEFVIILPGAALSDVRQIAEHLRHLVEDTDIPHNIQTLKVSVSIGGTSYPEHNADDFMSLLNIADTKLYQAKEFGRNTVIIE